MHELSVVLEIFELTDEISKEQNLTEIRSVSIEAGELCGIIPDYFRECWRAARIGSRYENTRLDLTVKPAIALCSCGREYEMTANGRVCPYCKRTDYTVKSGRQFLITQIEAK